MTHTHTLGPWRVSGPRLTSLTAQPVHDVFIGTGEDSAIVEGPNARANAALISAAPDMLAALIDLVNAMEPTYDTRHEYNAAIDAINKAKGQA